MRGIIGMGWWRGRGAPPKAALPKHSHAHPTSHESLAHAHSHETHAHYLAPPLTLTCVCEEGRVLLVRVWVL